MKLRPLDLNPSRSHFTRRRFSQMLTAAAAAAFAPGLQAQQRMSGPTMLLAANDPYCGLDILRTRFAAGLRPSGDMAGNALSWLLTGQDVFAQKTLVEMRGTSLPTKATTRPWLVYANWALAFDWLYEHPAFNAALKDAVAAQLMDAAIATSAVSDLKFPDQASYHNFTTRFLGLASFTLCALSKHRSHDGMVEELKENAARAFSNILAVTELVTPTGSYHESMDYMRITMVPMVMLAELQRTTTNVDPALRFGTYRSIADTYLYKLMPDGTPSREGDNEYPVLDGGDTVTLGYAVHRFKDPYAAWILRDSGFAARKWAVPVLNFLWNDPGVAPRNPASTQPAELPLHRYFPGVDQVVFRDSWETNATRIEFDCGPYFAKHQHLDRNHFSIYHRGHLAIDSGADYTDSESPHYLNYFRRTIAHNTMLVFDPKERFFWSENLVQAANDGGQRMDSSRFWNTVRSLDDWEKTRDVWELGHLKIVDAVDGASSRVGSYHYALGDATRAYSPHKLRCFTRQLLYLPGIDVLLVFDRVASTDPAFRKVWLLHGVNMPWVDGTSRPTEDCAEEFSGAGSFRFQEDGGELLVHTLLPESHVTTRRGGEGNDFWTPGDASGGEWGSGRNWPLDPAQGGPLPANPTELAMWRKFYNNDIDHIKSSNRKNVVPGSWRIEVTPTQPQLEDHFLHLFEIGDRDQTGKLQVELLRGSGIVGAASAAIGQAGIAALFSAGDAPLDYVELTLATFPCHTIWLGGLKADQIYALELAGSNLAGPSAAPPSVPLVSQQFRANKHGIAQLSPASGTFPRGSRMRVHSI